MKKRKSFRHYYNILKIETQRFIESIYLFLRYYKKVQKVLKENGYENIKIFKFGKWHLGYIYFIATKKKQEYFIKVDTKLHLLQNDVIFYNLAKKDKELQKHLIPIEEAIFKDDIQAIVFKYYKESKELDEKYVIENPHVVYYLVKILKKINSLGVIHRDIKLDNFLIIDGEIKIIDFTYANSLKFDKGFKEIEISKKNLNILELLGDKKNPKPFVWNDCFSLKTILNEISNKHNIEFPSLNSLDCNKFITYILKPEKIIKKQ